MTIVVWLPGSHHGLVWEHGAALLEGSLPLTDVVALWNRLEGCADLGDFFAALSEATGRALLDLPDFAVAVSPTRGGTHLAARGAFEARTSDGESVSGAGVRTWTERWHGTGDTVVLHADDGFADASQGERPVLGGLVPAGQLRLGTEEAVMAGAVPAPQAMPERSAPEPVPVVAKPDPEPEIDPEVEPVCEPEPAAEREAKPVAAVAESEFGDLWGDHTIFRGVEEAAVRPVATDEDGAAAPDLPHHEPDPEPEQPEPCPVGGGEVTWGDSMERPFDGFVSSVPKPHRPAAALPPSPVAARPPAPTTLALLRQKPGHEATELRAEGDPSHPGDLDEFGDHDGHTVMSLPQRSPEPPAAAPARDDQLLQGVLCPRGHANPTHRATCRLCDSPLGSESVRVTRPSLGRLAASTGEVIELTGPVIVGRDPRAARFQGTEIPRLLAIPQPHVSASHVEIRLEGWNVLALDLRSTNGTFLRRHSEPPVRLPELPQLLVAGDVLDLGHGVHLTFTGLP